MKHFKQTLCGLLSVLALTTAAVGCSFSGEFSTPIASVPTDSSTPADSTDSTGDSTPEDSTPDESTGGGGNQGDNTPDEPDIPAQSVALATFTLGANGSASHNDGTEGSSQSYSDSGYTLSITNATKTYFGARDAKGNSCIKVGTGKATGSFRFTVPSDVNSVQISIAKYKDNDSAVKINNVKYTLTKNSNDGQYEVISVDTSSMKTVSLSTVSGTPRAMINTIVFMSGTGGSQGGNGDQGGTDDGGNSGDQGESTTHRFTDFESDEKQLFLTYVGEVIPFLPNDEYYVEGWGVDNPYDYSDGLCFYTYGNTPAEFDAYRALYSGYTLVDTYVDSYGDTCYVYENATIQVDMCIYYYEDDLGSGYCVEIYACALNGTSGGNGGFDDSGNQGNTGGGNQGNTGGGSSNANLLKNDGKGLPAGTNGVYNVDFTKATYVKDVHDQGYYLNGCPTTGNVKVLVIPVEFSDVTASSKGYTISTIEKAFNGGAGTTDYYSVAEYYRISSYGKLNLTFDVMDGWFKPANRSSYYLNAKIDYSGEQIEGGDQIIINEFLTKYNSTMDFSQYDSDNNGTIDAVVLINTLTINYDVTMQWAYRYWNLYTDSRNEYYEYDGVYANDYLWASYQFLFEDESGDFNDKSACNTYTFIHEFGHVLGADDYYDTSYSGDSAPTDGHDIMDSELGDHNPYTKFNYGWITSSRLVTASNSVTLTLNAFDNSSSGTDTIIIANNWDSTLGAYQEYFVLIYYKNTGLNSDGGYFNEEGIVVYHVNATLYVDTEYGETYYDVYNNNTDPSDPDGYGTENNLLELVQNGRDYVFGVGDSLSANTKIDSGEKIAYTFTVTSLTSTTATITFTKNA